MAGINDILQEARKGFEASVDRLMSYLRIPSISADPAYDAACLEAARWTHDLLAGMGFRVRYAQTPAHPVVIGQYEPDHVDKNTLHILLYGHYDVQPPDPIELWKTPPFEPSRRKDSSGIERIYARGACDDKGQLMSVPRQAVALSVGIACRSIHARTSFHTTCRCRSRSSML